MAEHPRQIAVVTGSRADYGLLSWTMRAITAEPSLRLRLVATGSHLDPRFGFTASAIEADGFAVDEAVSMDLSDDAPLALADSLGRAVGALARALDRLAPDLVMLLGDRYEMLAAAEAALMLGLPIAHLHGGEVTTGAMDDSIRHAITKLANLHFVAADPYRRRVVQMGEDPARVHVVGALALDAIAGFDLPDADALALELDVPVNEPFLLMTYHPATRGEREPAAAVTEVIAALDEFRDWRVLATGVNADPGRDPVADAIARWAAGQPGRVHFVQSLGQRRYLAALKAAAVVVGNSSSGLIEAPALGTPTVNVGTRQTGRIRASSVIDCPEETRTAIVRAIRRALDPAFRQATKDAPYPLGTPGAAQRIVAVLRSLNWSELPRKQFFDLPEPHRPAEATA